MLLSPGNWYELAILSVLPLPNLVTAGTRSISWKNRRLCILCHDHGRNPIGHNVLLWLPFPLLWFDVSSIVPLVTEIQRNHDILHVRPSFWGKLARLKVVAIVLVSHILSLLVKAQFLPAVQIFFEWISLRGSPPVVACVGCASAWIYDYFVTEYPRAAGVRLLDTPNWLKRMFPSGQNNMASFGNTGGSRNVRIQPGSERPSNSVTGGHNWGRGNRLGWITMCTFSKNVK